tara:strand:+ start:856 stop:1086 length:231 start_codon:yes stop_codon:yes gene_type:complete
MNKTLYILLFALTLFGCIAGASSVKNIPSSHAAEIIEQNSNEMLELVTDMEKERVQAIYVVVISESELITAKPPEK